uniref:UDP-glucuronic acid decarboxylase 1 n=1 Tax=Plectus sambesii TaxID=2011161 RepID=A0A914W9C4_9BILA
MILAAFFLLVVLMPGVENADNMEKMSRGEKFESRKEQPNIAPVGGVNGVKSPDRNDEDTEKQLGKNEEDTEKQLGKNEEDTETQLGTNEENTEKQLGKDQEDTEKQLGKNQEETEKQPAKGQDDTEKQVAKDQKDTEKKPAKGQKDTDAEQSDAADKPIVKKEETAKKETDITLESVVEQLRAVQAELAQLKKDAAAQSKSSSNAVAPPPATRRYPTVKFRSYQSRKRILITGGTGFVGSHLTDKLMLDGHEVVVLDNQFTGRRRNVEHWIGHPNFELVHHDIVNPYLVEVDQVYHLASPASPPHYMYNPVKTIKTNTLGTINMLGLARRVKATMLLASTSEVYGDPEVHPQPETYWGHVNPIGPRSCYDEGKRVAESLMVAYHKQEKVDIRIARIFNTFGPRMHMNDGRVVSNFILQALQNKSITIYGAGNQTRSFQYVDDLVDGLIALMNSNVTIPVNLGNPEEHTISDFAVIIRDLVGSKSEIVNKPKQTDDPQQRKPDITRAGELLGWKPKVSMKDGLKKTIEFFRKELQNEKKEIEEENLHYRLAEELANAPPIV